jgi:hypothetical protein
LTFPEWNKVLETHPDDEFRAYILNGIRNGFRIGFDRSIACHLAATNMKSALENAEVVREYLSKEISLGRIIGPVGQEAIPPGTQVSPFGVIPKSSQPGKWRLIVDLSSPEGASVNVGINQELCSMTYLRLDEVTDRIARSGRGSLLAKLDIESAYRMVPIHPDDRPLLAVRWAGGYFFDTRLPFGLRSAPNIFTAAVADALQWAFLEEGVSWVAHYLDDFITVGPPNSVQLGGDAHLLPEIGSPSCSGEMCRPIGVDRVSGLRAGRKGNGGSLTTGQAAAYPEADPRMAEEKSLPKAGVGIASRSPSACGYSCSARPHVRTAANRARVYLQKQVPLDQTK